jgi:hypothetical protein
MYDVKFMPPLSPQNSGVGRPRKYPFHKCLAIGQGFDVELEDVKNVRACLQQYYRTPSGKLSNGERKNFATRRVGDKLRVQRTK